MTSLHWALIIFDFSFCFNLLQSSVNPRTNLKAETHTKKKEKKNAKWCIKEVTNPQRSPSRAVEVTLCPLPMTHTHTHTHTQAHTYQIECNRLKRDFPWWPRHLTVMPSSLGENSVTGERLLLSVLSYLITRPSSLPTGTHTQSLLHIHARTHAAHKHVDLVSVRHARADLQIDTTNRRGAEVSSHARANKRPVCTCVCVCLCVCVKRCIWGMPGRAARSPPVAVGGARWR